jgi:hypothetical protein
MPQEVRKRKQKNISYSAGNVESEQLSRGMIYRELYLRLRGTLTFSAGGDNSPANAQRGDEWNVIRNVKLVANHTDVIKRIRGADLWLLNYLWFGKQPEVTEALGDSNTTSVTFDSTLILPLWMPRAAKSIDFALDARELSGLEIEVEWADGATSISSGASGFSTNPTLDVYSLESFGIEGPFTQWRLYPIEREVVATNPELQVELPVSYMYRGFTIEALVDDAHDSGVVNNLKIRSGSTIFEDVQADIASEIFRLRNSLDKNPQMKSDAFDIDAVYRLDHVTDGYMTEAIDTLGFSEFTLEFDVNKLSGTNKLIIYPDQLVPIRGEE